MKNIYYLFLGLMTIMGFAACNNEWEDEQYLLQASFKANVTDQGVTTTYVRFNSGGVVKYNLPILMSGSTVNTQNRTIHIGLDPDTLAVLNSMVIVKNFIFGSCPINIIICRKLWKC